MLLSLAGEVLIKQSQSIVKCINYLMLPTHILQLVVVVVVVETGAARDHGWVSGEESGSRGRQGGSARR